MNAEKYLKQFKKVIASMNEGQMKDKISKEYLNLYKYAKTIEQNPAAMPKVPGILGGTKGGDPMAFIKDENLKKEFDDLKEYINTLIA